MFLNSLTWKQRSLLGLGALFFTLPLSFHLYEVDDARRFARVGVAVEARITELHVNPKQGRPYAAYRYTHDNREHDGVLGGAGGWRLGQSMTVSVDPASPGRSRPGDAKAEVDKLVWWSVFAAVGLAGGIACLAGPRKEPKFPKNHLLSE
jgi:hypothetical protein